MTHGMKLFLNVILSTALFGLFILVAVQEGITDIFSFFLRDYFTATLAVSIALLNGWISWLDYQGGVDYLEGFWSVDVLVEMWRGLEDKPVRGKGDMYLVRRKPRNSFHGYIQLEYVDRTDKTMFVATYRARFDLKMKRPLSRVGNVEGHTIMICRKPVEKEGHDSFVKEHVQKLTFNKENLVLEGETRIEGQEVFGKFKARKESP